MFAKVFRQIFQSSIAEDPELRFTFMDFLVLADSDGVVDMTPESIARVTNRPLDVIRRTVAVLEGPDARSRTPDCDGQRIQRLDDHRDWGWIIVNYDRFRRIASEEQRREKTRNRVAKFRGNRSHTETCGEEKKPVTVGNAGNAMDLPLPLLIPVPASSPEGGTGGRVKIPPSLEQVMAIGKDVGLPDAECEKFWHHFESNGWRVGGKAPMKNVRSALFNWKSRMSERSPSGNGGPKHTSAPPGIQLVAVKEQISKHPANRESIFYKRDCSPEQRKEYQELVARASELNRLVGLQGRGQ